jgi:hypothetical protein
MQRSATQKSRLGHSSFGKGLGRLAPQKFHILFRYEFHTIPAHARFPIGAQLGGNIAKNVCSGDNRCHYLFSMPLLLELLILVQSAHKYFTVSKHTF